MEGTLKKMLESGNVIPLVRWVVALSKSWLLMQLRD